MGKGASFSANLLEDYPKKMLLTTLALDVGTRPKGVDK